MTDELTPPRKSVELEDPGAHELASESDDHFSDASEGRNKPKLPAPNPGDVSPIPMTRVERVDDEPSYGEVPGTEAYKKRVQDAVPDEVEVVPEGSRSRSASRVSARDRPVTPGGSPIPKTVVEKVDPAKPSHGDVPGTHAYELRAADAVPDVVLKAPQVPGQNAEGLPTASLNRSPEVDDDRNIEASQTDATAADSDECAEEAHDTKDMDNDGEFGDDFDDFEEGDEGDDFGDFDDGFQQGEERVETSFDRPTDHATVPAPPPGPPVLDFADLTTAEEVVQAAQPYMDDIYQSKYDVPSITAEHQQDIGSIFLSERSLSLWAQLVAPPPLQPPDWVRSRIRRLFLVSLGVPVDLDEILPASKQKKLILPSIHVPGDRSPRISGDERPNGALARVKRENASSASVDSSSSKAERKRKGPSPPPPLDLSAATMLCSTTEAALNNFTDEELQAHIKRLEEFKQRANELFEYWTKRMESALGDKEAFEGVIENLVMHAKKVRK